MVEQSKSVEEIFNQQGYTDLTKRFVSDFPIWRQISNNSILDPFLDEAIEILEKIQDTKAGFLNDTINALQALKSLRENGLIETPRGNLRKTIYTTSSK